MLQVQLEVGPDPAEVGRARRWARSRLAGSGIGLDEPLAETLLLLISELVTNAVVHTGCPAVLRIRLPGTEAAAVRVEVADASARPPRPRHAEGDDTNGRGLELVDGLADRWGWQPEGAGKQIWCELDRGADSAGRSEADEEAALLAVYGSYSACDVFEVQEPCEAHGPYDGRGGYGARRSVGPSVGSPQVRTDGGMFERSRSRANGADRS